MKRYMSNVNIQSLAIIIDKFLSKNAIKLLLNKDVNVSLKEEYAHWENETEKDDETEKISNFSGNKLKNIIDRKLELLKVIEEGIEINSITVNSKKNITIRNENLDFSATLILNDEVKEALKKLF